MLHLRSFVVAAVFPATVSSLVSPELAGQSIVSPDPFYATREGDLSAAHVFSRPSRLQQIHGDLIGTARLITGIAFRRDGISNGAAHAPVPSKTVQLNLVMADAVAVATASNVFASNMTGNVVTVFSGSVSTPASWATPARAAPAPIDFRIPIVPWPYAGTGAFLWDADSSATSDNQRIDLDAAQSRFPLFSWCSYDMHGSGCTTPNGEFELRGSGQNLGGLGSFTVKVTAHGAPPTTTCAWLVGFAPLDAPIPGLCSRLWPQSLASMTRTSDALGKVEPHFQVPSNPAALGLPLEMQMFAPDASQRTGIPIAGSNGLTYRVEPMAPAFAACTITSTTSGSPSGTLLNARGVVVRFD